MTARAAVLGEWLHGMSRVPAPAALADKAALHLLDTLGAMAAGGQEAAARIAGDVHDRPGPVPLLGTDRSRALLDAAFVNGVAAHSLEIDDTEGCDHSGAVVVPVLWSAHHAGRTTPGLLLPALIAGYEIGRRVQLSLGGYDRHNGAGWHSTATCGVFAAAAAASVLWRLTAQQSANALGIAASSAGGTWAFAADGAMTKQLHPGMAARAGLEAAQLAARGVTGPAQIFDDVWGGFLATRGGDQGDAGVLTGELGSRWHFTHSAIKPYAVCRSAHTAIDALRGILADEAVDPADVTRVRLHVGEFLRPMICPPVPRDAAQARMSLPIAVALLLDGAPLLPHDFDAFESPRVRSVLRRVEVVPDPQPGREPLVEVHTAGRSYRRRVLHARGGAADPLPGSEVREKFHGLADRAIGVDRADALERWVDALPAGPPPDSPAPSHHR